MPTIETLQRLGDKVCNDYLGFLPTSDSTKPPYIANNLFRFCTGETCKVTDIHDWIVSERRKGAVSSEQIIQDYKDVFVSGEDETPANVKQFRYLLDAIFNQDNTVYPDYGFSAYNISSHWLIKKSVPSDSGIGRFLFAILSKEIDGKRSPAISLISEALKNDKDDLTKLIKPIIAFPSEEEKRIVDSIDYPEDSEIVWDELKAKIREGFDILAENIIKSGEDKNTLLVLERIISYAGFSAYWYLSNAISARYNKKLTPMLFDSGIDSEAIKQASAQSFVNAKKSVEDFFTLALNDILSEEVTTDSKQACKRWIDEMSYSSTERETRIAPAINKYFESYCDEEDSAIYALARALQNAIYAYKNKSITPSDFLKVVGNRCGLIGPRGNRAVKRYFINSFTLETITLSAVSNDLLEDGIEYKELAEMLMRKYNIMLGVNIEEEYELLQEKNIVQNTPGDLRGDLSLNARSFADMFIAIGMGKKYADGVTLIGRRL